MCKEEFKRGLKSGVPIGLGYFPVSLAFGILATSCGLSPVVAIIISMTNLTSAGQFAGVGVIAAGGTSIEMALTMLMINARYFLMSLALSQKFSKHFSQLQRMLVAFGVTDEVFTVASLEKKALTPSFMWGLILLPYIGWTLGTLTGAMMSDFLPMMLQDALGIALYGMFIALLMPAAKGERAVCTTIIVSTVISSLLHYMPGLKSISSGFAIIITTCFAAGIMAYVAPIKEEQEEASECLSSSIS